MQVVLNTDKKRVGVGRGREKRSDKKKTGGEGAEKKEGMGERQERKEEREADRDRLTDRRKRRTN